MLTKLVGIVLFVGLVFGLAWWFDQSGDDFWSVRIGEQTYQLEVADDPTERTQGLSGRTELAPNSGMLFVFDEPAQHGIWMKDMNFAIDIIWLDESKEIIEIVDEASPASYPETFYPDRPAKYVIELPAGVAQSHDLDLGDSLEF